MYVELYYWLYYLYSLVCICTSTIYQRDFWDVLCVAIYDSDHDVVQADRFNQSPSVRRYEIVIVIMLSYGYFRDDLR